MITAFAVLFAFAYAGAMIYVLSLAVKGEAKHQTELENERYRRIAERERVARLSRPSRAT